MLTVIETVGITGKITERERQECYGLRTFPKLLSLCLHLGLLDDLLFSGFPMKKLHVFHLSHISVALIPLPNAQTQTLHLVSSPQLIV